MEKTKLKTIFKDFLNFKLPCNNSRNAFESPLLKSAVATGAIISFKVNYTF